MTVPNNGHRCWITQLGLVMAEATRLVGFIYDTNKNKHPHVNRISILPCHCVNGFRVQPTLLEVQKAD